VGPKPAIRGVHNLRWIMARPLLYQQFMVLYGDRDADKWPSREAELKVHVHCGGVVERLKRMESGHAGVLR
jgi:hypothetical protein